MGGMETFVKVRRCGFEGCMRVEPCTLLIKGQAVWNLFTSSHLKIEKVRMEKDIRNIGKNRHILNYIRILFQKYPINKTHWKKTI
jgi:hypothetical protein